MLKKCVITLFIISITITGFAQDKIKGNKNVTIVETKIDDFKAISFGEKFEIELVQSNDPSVAIETDENLHEVIEFSVTDSVLNFRTLLKIQSRKQLKIIVNYTTKLRQILINDDAEISAVGTIKNKDLELRINDYSKAYLNVDNQHFKLINNNTSTFGINSKSKLNIESDYVTLELNENSKTEALIVTDSLQVEMYQSAFAKIEGETDFLNLLIINSSEFSAKNLSVNNCKINTEDSSETTVQVLDEILIETSGSSEIYIYGDPKITLNAFKDSSSIHKKKL
jgi:hypothetical protein